MMDTGTIKQTVADFYGIPRNGIDAADRRRLFARPRQVAMTLTRELTTRSLTSIGAQFGRDHTTVMHAMRRVEELTAADPCFASEVEQIRATLQGATAENWFTSYQRAHGAAVAIADGLKGMGDRIHRAFTETTTAIQTLAKEATQ